MKYIFDIEIVQPGMRLYESVLDPKSGIVLIAANTILTQNHIEILKRRGILELSINLTNEEKQKYQYDHNVIPTVSTSIVKNTSAVLKSINGIKPLNDKSIQEVINYAQKIVNSIMMDNNFIYKLTDYKISNEIAEHSIRTATYAVALARTYNNNLKDLKDSERQKRTISLENIALAALFHDIGKSCVNDNVRLGINEYVTLGPNFPTITEEKCKDLRDNYDQAFNPYYGYNILHDNRLISPEVKVTVLLSGEDNAGYGPLKVQNSLKFRNSVAKHIVAAKIINLCSRFDEFMIDNIKDEITLENAYEGFRNLFTKEMFEDYFLEYFINSIPLYPLGTKVLLHGAINGYAIVVETFTDKLNYSKPKLITIPERQLIDLRYIQNTTIKQVIGDEVRMYELLINAYQNDEQNMKSK